MSKLTRNVSRKIKTNTRKNRNINSSATLHKFEREITVQFLEMLNTIKLYHWKTYSYATHKATDELYEKLGEHTDKFIEVLLGKAQNRTNLLNVKHIRLRDMKNHEDFKRVIKEYKNYLVNLKSNKAMNLMSNSDLFNIRDEILADLNQFLYLYTFK
jgi:DNA-binding ferritin-like protein